MNLFLSALLLVLRVAGQPLASLLIRDVNIVDVNTGTILKCQSVTISNEAIVALESAKESPGSVSEGIIEVTGDLPANFTVQSVMQTGLDGLEHQRSSFPTNHRQQELTDEINARHQDGLPMPPAEVLARQVRLHDAEEASRVLSDLAERNFWITPPLLVQRRVRVEIAERDFENDTRKRYFARAIWDSWNSKAGLRKPLAPEHVAVWKRALQETAARTLELQRAGIPLLAGSDSGVSNNYILPGWALHEELQALVAAGLSPADALRTATINPARWRGDSRIEGTIQPGRHANLVLLRSNPLSNIAATREIEAVFLAGEYYPRRALGKMLDRAASLETMLVSPGN
jgi:hypothetical protein